MSAVRMGELGGDARQKKWNLPHYEQEKQRREEIVALVVKKVVDDAVVPAIQVTHVGRGEPGRAQQKIIQAPEGWRLHVRHLSWTSRNLMSQNATHRKGADGENSEAIPYVSGWSSLIFQRGACPRITCALSAPQQQPYTKFFMLYQILHVIYFQRF